MFALKGSQGRRALADLWHALRYPDLWVLLGWQDIRQRYRRSMLGPFWLTISTGVMVIALGFVYASIFRQPIDEYLPYLAAGLVIWSFIAGTVTEGCQTFIASEGIIKQIRVPLFTHVMRVVWRNFIILCHNAVIIVAVVAIFLPANALATLALAIPALVLLILTMGWITLLVGMFSARFRDIPQIVTNILQLMFFLTPIIWHPSLLPGRNRVVLLNPLYHMVEIVRAPLLGKMPGAATWIAVGVMGAIGWILAALLFRQFRRRIAYWV
ncbi:MAG: ABC transporter permease [Betaproteobacteria bacterium]|nr:MAG: ABC transporter permease [Betaproteobacteria bacterium]